MNKEDKHKSMKSHSYMLKSQNHSENISKSDPKPHQNIEQKNSMTFSIFDCPTHELTSYV